VGQPSEAATLPPSPPPAEAPTDGEVVGVSVPGYEVLGLLGRGGMGVVYKARQVQADRLVALKMILHAEHADDNERARFQTEVRAVARLQHPHIVQVYEVSEHNGLPFFSLEFCTGGGLDRKLAGTPLEARLAAALVEKLARAMHAAHQAHVIHRDLKPANVLLTAEGEPKITDFGLAKRLDEQGRTQTGAVMGTPSYMAPEQAGGGKEVSPATDVYALGAILYECLTGRPPFKAATMMDTLYQVIHDEPVPPSQFQSKVPRDLETICLKCLHKEPAKRYTTAAALADDLGRFQRGEPIAARPVGRLERAVKWVRRKPALAAMMAVLGLLTAVSLAVFVVLWRNADLERRQAVQAQKAEAEQREKADKASEQARADSLAARNAEALAEERKTQAQERELLARRFWYDADINMAHKKWQSGDLIAVRRLLEAHRPAPGEADLRGFDWYHLWRLGVAELATFKDFPEGANGVAFSPDGKLLVSASRAGTMVLRDLATGKVRTRLRGAAVPVFSPDGNTLAGGNKRIGGFNGEPIKLWNPATGEELTTLRGSDGCIAFSPDGTTLATEAGMKEIKLWDVKTGQQHGRMDTASYLYSLAFSPNGTMLASSGGVTQLWDVATRTELARLPDANPAVFSVAFSPDSRLLAGATYIKTIVLWDTAQKKTRAILEGHPREIYCLAFSPDGHTLASGDFDGNVKLWDVADHREITTLKRHRGEVFSVAFSADGRMLASASGDGTVKLWEISALRNRNLRLPSSWSMPIEHLAFSPDGRHLAAGYDEIDVELWDAARMQKRATFSLPNQWIRGIAFSFDSGSLIAGSMSQQDRKEKITQWSLETQKELDAMQNLLAAQQFKVRTFSLDGKLLLAEKPGKGGHNSYCVWDLVTSRERIHFTGSDQAAISAAFSADRRLLALGLLDRTVQLWDTQTGQLRATLRGFSQLVYALAFSPDGSKLASGGGDLNGKSRGEVRLWDVQTGREAAKLEGHPEEVRSLAFSRDGKTLASASGTIGGAEGTEVRLWDTVTGRETVTLAGSKQSRKMRCASAVAWPFHQTAERCLPAVTAFPFGKPPRKRKSSPFTSFGPS
jgi:WD40 repeat protein/tRNA A-37 threonylcarbamoyl transferase component Bud32